VARIASRGAGLPGSPLRIGRRAIAALCCVVLGSVAVGVAAGQGGANGARASSSSPHTPLCAQTSKVVARPSEVPAAVLPPQTVLTSVARPIAGMTLVTGVVPHEFRNVVEFFVATMPAAGFRNGAGDAEMDEAEALFNGPGVNGKWKVNGILACPGAVRLAVYVRR
jgi:hypothetical protein